MNTIRVAVAQMTCLDGQIDANLAHASKLAIEAKKGEAELILFPEFMTQGYRLTTEIWDSAEPFNGPTTSWLCATAKELGVYIGTSFLEASKGHFLNTFAVANPSGKMAGIVRKRYPSMWEAYFFKGLPGEHTFETDFGRVGVGICFDNHTYRVASILAKSNPAIILMPHSFCTPTVPTKLMPKTDIDRLNNLPRQVAQQYNSIFGVPVLMCNKTGSWNSPVPNKLLGTPRDYSFPGRSIILDANGTPVVELGNVECVGVGQVTLITDLPIRKPIPKHSRYIYPGPIGREIIRLMELQGKLSYTLNKERKKMALSAEQAM